MSGISIRQRARFQCLLFSEQGRSSGLLTTVWRLAKLATFTTKLDTKNQCSNIRETVIRSTEPPILPNACYAFVVLSVVDCLSVFMTVLVRLLGGSFGFFCIGLCGCKKYKCATNYEVITNSYKKHKIVSKCGG